MAEDSQPPGDDAANQSQDWLRRGDDLVQQNRPEEALLAYEQAIRLDPGNARAYCKLRLSSRHDSGLKSGIGFDKNDTTASRANRDPSA